MACRLVGAKPLPEPTNLGTNLSEMLIEIHTFSFKKMHLKMSSGKWRPFCIGLNVLTNVSKTGQGVQVFNNTY